jgi:hypothetical protein
MEFEQFARDRHEIEQVYFLYCDLIDTKDFDGLTGVFTPDTVGDYRSIPGKHLVAGLAPLVESMHHNMGAGSNCGRTHHNVMNLRASIDGDHARTRAHYFAVHRGLNAYEGQLYSMWGEYNDRWIRTDEGWRVAYRGYDSMVVEGPREICSRTAGPGRFRALAERS